MTPNHIYSNCYRRSLASGYGLTESKLRAQEAAAQFRILGYVSEDYVGCLKPQKRQPKAKAKAASKSKAAPKPSKQKN